MEKVKIHGWMLLLSALLLATGCKEDPPPAQKVTLEELNAALTYLKEKDMDPPQSVYELTNLPALRGKVFPTLPEGQYFSINPENNQVTIEIEHLPDMPDAFPHQGRF
jgi:hypothetical protein